MIIDLSDLKKFFINRAELDWEKSNIFNAINDMITDNLTTNNSSKILSAKQGKVLNDNKEDKSNKSSSITTDTGSTTKYPTVKAVEDYAQPIGNYLTSHQDLSNYVQKSQTSGLIKNDGSIDTNTYLTQHQDISSKANITDLSTVAFSGDYDDLSNKPTTFTPKSHNHGRITNDGKLTDINGNVVDSIKILYTNSNGNIIGTTPTTSLFNNNYAYDNIKTGESTTLTMDNQKKVNDGINTKFGEIETLIGQAITYINQ